MPPPVLPPCPTIPSAGGWHYGVILAVVIVYAVSLFALIAWSGTRGFWWLTVPGVWLASAVPLAVIATQWEDRSIRPLMHSGALIGVDATTLPLVLGICATAIPLLRGTIWERKRWWWLGGSIVLGVGVSIMFHLGEAVVYGIYRLHSLTKIVHDWASYPILATAWFYLAVPVLLSPRRVGWWRWSLVMGGTLLMAYLLYHESHHSLGASVYHPEADISQWGRVITCSFPH